MALAVCLLVSGAAGASSSVTGTITELHIGKNYGNFVFIKVDASNTNPYSSCHSNTHWNYTLPLTSELDKQMYAALLVAYSSGRPTRLEGLNACNEFSGVESLKTVRLES